ncbi:glycosyltransferase [Pseudoalteromonas sp. HL-AS2]|uniref:glycosyltransferase family 2 protein n=1 Tax=Pseudoalteromonas sp. HL-AS2 TaxID=3071082 RepID=UPI002815D56A|nr:glycosyltransferase [Pseudoalteromonas sp. HL-AS2]WMS94895.1 glycosyltransferase [Pseudoalteromonas sp. HL-AS2]
MKPRFSVIVPVYNSEEHISSCLDSIVSATKSVAIEVLVIDDGSTDSSSGIVKEYEERFNFIHLISQANGGPSAARNTGLSRAKGDYITFVDSDDQISENFFSVLEPLCERKPDIVVFGYERVSTTGQRRAFSPKVAEHKNSSRQLLETVSKDLPLFWFAWTKIYRSETLDELRFDERIRLGEDTIFNIEAVSKAKLIIRVADILYSYFEVEGSLSSPKYKPALLANMQSHFEARVAIHSRGEGLSKYVKQDICEYYLLHIVTWLTSNAMRNDNIDAQLAELHGIRNSEFVKTCLAWGAPKPKTIGLKVTHTLFRARMFRALRAWIAFRSRGMSNQNVGVV